MLVAKEETLEPVQCSAEKCEMKVMLDDLNAVVRVGNKFFLDDKSLRMKKLPVDESMNLIDNGFFTKERVVEVNNAIQTILRR